MTSGARPNLGGLFNGSTPPEKLNGSSVRPKLILSTPLAAKEESTSPGPATVAADAKSAPPAGPPTKQAGLEWLDPVKAVEQYFAFLQSLLDTNRGLMVALATTVASLPGRLGMRP